MRDNTDAAAQEADDYVSEQGTSRTSAIEIFGSNDCTYCAKAKALCDKYGLKYKYYNVDEDMDAFWHLVSRIKSWKTVPQIFWGQVHLDGYEDLAKYLNVAP